MYPNEITTIFYDYVKMKCPIILLFIGLNLGPLAATKLKLSRIYSYPRFSQYMELEAILRLNSAKSIFTLHGGLRRF